MTAADRIMSRSLLARRTLALLLLPLAAIAVWGLLFLPLKWVTTSQGAWRDTVRVELARERGRAHALPALRQQLERLPAEPVWQRFYRVEGGADGGAAVQQDVGTLCAAAGLENQTITPLPSEEEGPLMKYSVRLSASGTSDRLEMFAAKLRQHPRYLRTDRLSITAPQVQQREQNPVLTLTMDIAGYSAALPAPLTASVTVAKEAT